MTTITITDINQLCVGDVAKFTYRGGHEFSGVVWDDGDGNQFVGGTVVRRGRCADLNEYNYVYVTFISATREVLLPTELGSVIADVTDTDGYYYFRAMRSVDGKWDAINEHGKARLRPEEIASWAECRVEVLR